MHLICTHDALQSTIKSYRLLLVATPFNAGGVAAKASPGGFGSTTDFASTLPAWLPAEQEAQCLSRSGTSVHTGRMDTTHAAKQAYLERPTSEAIAAMPVFPGLPESAVCLVETPEHVAAAARAFAGVAVVGFDTESKPNFLPNQPKTGPHLIQLATAEQAFLFRADGGAGLEALREVLESPSVLKVGFGLSNDRGPLSAKLRIRLRHTLDLCPLVKRLGYRQKVGLQAAVAIVLGQRLLKSKKVQTSNWSAKVLSPAQRVYAANDAYASLQVYERLLRGHPALLGASGG